MRAALVVTILLRTAAAAELAPGSAIGVLAITSAGATKLPLDRTYAHVGLLVAIGCNKAIVLQGFRAVDAAMVFDLLGGYERPPDFDKLQRLTRADAFIDGTVFTPGDAPQTVKLHLRDAKTGDELRQFAIEINPQRAIQWKADAVAMGERACRELLSRK